MAIENAWLFDERSRRHRWLAAAAEASTAITRDLRRAPSVVSGQARNAGRCTTSVSLPTTALDDEGLVDDAGEAGAMTINGVAGEASASLLYRTVYPDRETPDFESIFAPDDGYIAQAAFRVRHRSIGVLALCRTAPAWSDAELESVQAFADHVALAVEHARNEHNRHRLAVFTDRDRIARDLHDHVIQRIFAVGLGLQGLVRRTTDQDTRARLENYADDLDTTISEIRTTIFSLHRQSEAGPPSLRGDITALVGEAARVLGFEPEITLIGPIDAAVPPHLSDDILATLRESLSNVVRHARADAVNVLVRVDVDAKTLALQVEDNGVGIDPHHPLRHWTPQRLCSGGGIRRLQHGRSTGHSGHELHLDCAATDLNEDGLGDDLIATTRGCVSGLRRGR